MFQFPPFASTHLCIQCGMFRFHRNGLPHSGTPGSTPASDSPRLFAANHALHRLLAPRHPPYALISLTISLPLAKVVDCSALCLIPYRPNCQRTIQARSPKVGAKSFPFAAAFGLPAIWWS
jgi:hypothetical protein